VGGDGGMCGGLGEKNAKEGGRAVWLEIGLGLGFFFCYFFLNVQNCLPFL
jgi:hypothetical protein